MAAAARRILFGNNAGVSPGRKHLLEFKAGKMTMKGKMVNPDKRKGLVYIHQTDDSLMHFCWKDRTSGTVEDDLIIFPDDAEYKKVTQCTTGRVYVLRFKSSSRKFFFWMQESKSDKDDEHCTKINELLNNPPAPGSSSGNGSSGISGLPAGLASDGEFHNILNNMNQQQLMQLFGGMGGLGGMSSLLGPASRSSTGSSQQSTRNESSSASPSVTSASSGTSTSTTNVSSTVATPSTTTTTTNVSSGSTTSTTPSNAVRLADLQNILSSIKVPEDGSSGAGTAGVASSSTPVDLSKALTAESLKPILSNPELLKQLANLVPKTGGEKTEVEEVKSTIQSPQFQQAMGMFSAALQSGQLGPLMQQFGMDGDVVGAANSGDMEAFIKALQDKTDEESDKDETKKDDKDDDDEGMSLD